MADSAALRSFAGYHRMLILSLLDRRRQGGHAGKRRRNRLASSLHIGKRRPQASEFLLMRIQENGPAMTATGHALKTDTNHSTVTDFARFRGLSTSVPRIRATW